MMSIKGGGGGLAVIKGALYCSDVGFNHQTDVEPDVILTTRFGKWHNQLNPTPESKSALGKNCKST